MPSHSLDLLLDAGGDTAVRAVWQRLREAELPSQADHRSPTNAPHLTLLETRDPLDAELLDRVADRLAGVLPTPVAVAGLLVLGERRPSVAWALDVADALLAAVLEIRAWCPEPPAQAWLPHLTLARRVAPDQLAPLRTAVGPPPAPLLVAGLRRWDPVAARVTDVPLG